MGRILLKKNDKFTKFLLISKRKNITIIFYWFFISLFLAGEIKTSTKNLFINVVSKKKQQKSAALCPGSVYPIFQKHQTVFFFSIHPTLYSLLFTSRLTKKNCKSNHSQVCSNEVIPLKLERATKRMKVGEKSSKINEDRIEVAFFSPFSPSEIDARYQYII